MKQIRRPAGAKRRELSPADTLTRYMHNLADAMALYRIERHTIRQAKRRAEAEQRHDLPGTTPGGCL